MILPCKNVTRRALVIGNSSYKTLTSIDHSIQDAEDIGAKLRSMQFEVTINTDLNYDQMATAQDEFIDTISESDIVVFFYAGYGIQWKNQNYLLPINDDEITSDCMLPYQTINIEKFLKTLFNHETSTVIFLLDISFSEDFEYTSRKPFYINSMNVPSGSIILYSNGIDNTTNNGSETNRNGLLTSYILSHLDASNQSIDEVFASIRDQIARNTNDLHTPHLIDSLIQNKLFLNAHDRYAPLCPVYIESDSKWLQHGVTVAGGHGHGGGYNQLFNPWSVYVDDDQSVLIADQLNHRIIEWKADSALVGHVIAGGNGQGDRNNQLSCPTDVLVHHQTDSLIICDRDNRRIVRWSRQNGRIGEVLISDIDCIALTLDNYGSLYVSDDKKHEVRRYEVGKSHSVRVAGGNGRGNRLDQLNEPRNIFVDQRRSVYVTDHGNHRVMVWPDGAEQGHIVVGNQKEKLDSMNIYFPQGIVVDQNGSIYVAEGGKHRIIRLSKDNSEIEILVGSQRKGIKSNELNWPFGLCFDRYQNLYVVDVYNHRVQKFHLDQ